MLKTLGSRVIGEEDTPVLSLSFRQRRAG